MRYLLISLGFCAITFWPTVLLIGALSGLGPHMSRWGEEEHVLFWVTYLLLACLCFLPPLGMDLDD